MKSLAGNENFGRLWQKMKTLAGFGRKQKLWQALAGNELMVVFYKHFLITDRCSSFEKRFNLVWDSNSELNYSYTN